MSTIQFAITMLFGTMLILLVLTILESIRQQNSPGADLIKRHVGAHFLTSVLCLCLCLYYLGSVAWPIQASLLYYSVAVVMLFLSIKAVNKYLYHFYSLNLKNTINLALQKSTAIFIYSVLLTILTVKFAYYGIAIFAMSYLFLNSGYKIWGQSIFYRYKLKESMVVRDVFIQALFKKVAPTYQITILLYEENAQDLSINASITPHGLRAGTLILSKGWTNISPRDRITALLSHEIAHLTQRHTLKYEVMVMLANVLFLSFIAYIYHATFDKNINAIALFLSVFSWRSVWYFLSLPCYNLVRKHFELSADKIACAHCGTETFLQFLLFLKDQNQLVDNFPHYFEWIFATHPSFQKRCEYIYTNN
jgi:Zn-dependent protease with chaperone function